jgi:hypothetical protein
MLYRSNDPGLDDLTGGPDPVPAPLDGEHVEHLHKAYGHIAKCVKRLERALDLLNEEPLDDEPLFGEPFSDDEVWPILGYDDKG